MLIVIKNREKGIEKVEIKPKFLIEWEDSSLGQERHNNVIDYLRGKSSINMKKKLTKYKTRLVMSQKAGF